MRSAEGLVQVDVHYIEANLAGLNDTQNGVKVRAVTVHQAARLVNDLGHFQQILVKQTQGIGVGEHQTGRIRPGHLAQVGQIYIATAVTFDRDYLETAHRSGGRVGAVGSVGNQDFGASRV